MPSTNIGTLGKYDQKAAEKINQNYWSFIQNKSQNSNLSLNKKIKGGGGGWGGGFHCEINAFSSPVGHNYWHQIIATSFSQDNSSEVSLIIPEELGDQRPFLHTESLQILQIHSSMLGLLLISSPHSFYTGFRSEDRNSHGRRFILCSVTHFSVDFDVCFGLLSWWKIQPRPIKRFLTEAIRFRFFTCWYLIGSMMACIWTRCPEPRDGPHCRTQDPGCVVGSRSNSSHLTYTWTYLSPPPDLISTP